MKQPKATGFTENGHFVLMMQEVLLGLLAASVFYHSWFLRHWPSSLYECWIESSDPEGPLFFPSSQVILWQVTLDRGTVECLMIASVSSWMSSKLVMVWFVWTQAGGSLLLWYGYVWLSALTSCQPFYSSICFFSLFAFFLKRILSFLVADGIKRWKNLLCF